MIPVFAQIYQFNDGPVRPFLLGLLQPLCAVVLPHSTGHCVFLSLEHFSGRSMLPIEIISGKLRTRTVSNWSRFIYSQANGPSSVSLSNTRLVIVHLSRCCQRLIVILISPLVLTCGFHLHLATVLSDPFIGYHSSVR